MIASGCHAEGRAGADTGRTAGDHQRGLDAGRQGVYFLSSLCQHSFVVVEDRANLFHIKLSTYFLSPGRMQILSMSYNVSPALNTFFSPGAVGRRERRLRAAGGALEPAVPVARRGHQQPDHRHVAPRCAIDALVLHPRAHSKTSCEPAATPVVGFCHFTSTVTAVLVRDRTTSALPESRAQQCDMQARRATEAFSSGSGLPGWSGHSDDSASRSLAQVLSCRAGYGYSSCSVICPAPARRPLTRAHQCRRRLLRRAGGSEGRVRDGAGFRAPPLLLLAPG